MSLRSSRKRRARQRAVAESGDRQHPVARFGGSTRFADGSVREMAQEDVIAAIPEDQLAAIRAEDPHPLFVAIDIAQEGESGGEMVVNGQSVGAQKKLWDAKAIGEFAAKLGGSALRGIAKLWHGKSHDEKREVGHVVRSLTQKIGDKLHAMAVCWVRDPDAKADFAAGKISTGSMEADCEFERTDRNWLVRGVKAVAGIVLAGQGVQPGFPGASVIASVQELGKPEEKDMGEEVLTLRDVQDAIRDNGWTPTQIYGAETLLKDRTVVDATAEQIKAEIEKATSEHEEKLKALEADAAAWQKHQVNSTVADLIKQSPALKDATKGTAAFVAKALDGRIDLAGIDEDKRQALVDSQIKSQLDFIKDTGITVPEPENGSPEPKPKPGDPPKPGVTRTAGGVEGVTIVDGKDMTDPANNPQIAD
jgi:3-dehydroquinate dehydratase